MKGDKHGTKVGEHKKKGTYQTTAADREKKAGRNDFDCNEVRPYCIRMYIRFPAVGSALARRYFPLCDA